ncbi:DUF2784 domain-containing protein [Mycolicibacterium smegmatis]|uniref:DUF2784 domain-containing protein n=1 Tax=Mycolicibacterium smegmatis (strain MKD8) TaxID=1214915 RepID=A0A2U9PNS9_MYCSE|nr:DUF2784 domain-containing protein [Mycolicibacterium smegmatis]AWT53295.1 hypothetical protein D806_023140 [Mycolicibacterium smegmatis MKD8]MCP2622352.1 DUF2784 domain-containing protein [Mycolicibacterium smegmatis]
MKKAYTALVAITVGAHFGYLLYLPSGGFLALRWPRTLAFHVPTVIWGAFVVALRLRCPLTHLEQWARVRAGLKPLPADDFIDHYADGVLYPANRTGAAQAAAFTAAALSWLLLFARRRRITSALTSASRMKTPAAR